VRIQLAGADYLSLAEVKVRGRVVNVGSNLAEGKSTAQSSAYRDVGAERAVDGNTDGVTQHGSVTHTGYEAQPWWEVDLGAQSEIDAIEIWNRTDAHGDRLSDFYVFVSETPFTAGTVAETLARADVWHQRVTIDGGPAPSVQLTAGTRGRYVRIQLAGTNWLSLAEVKVLGRPVTVGDNLVEG
jgi:alpha-L-fucosidase 2